jgi:hypothetical protein
MSFCTATVVPREGEWKPIVDGVDSSVVIFQLLFMDVWPDSGWTGL